jgi:DNA (cytosine-5)-methyltransferase 1
MAANHWQTAIDVHQHHFPDAGHDPRRYPRTNILLASPECTNHSQARGVSRKQQDPSLWDAPDPSAERSRATMWDVPRFAEQMRYDAIVVENVTEATKWVGWRGWHQVMADLGYQHRVVSANSMHHGVPQSRDRIYVVFWRRGLSVDLDREAAAWCPTCDRETTAVQGWKNGRTVGRYRTQWVWVCQTCAKEAHVAAPGAEEIIDWSLPCPRIRDRARPLAENTRARIAAGIARWWEPFITAGAGNTYETTPGNRSKPLTEPLPTQQTTATHALAVPMRRNGKPTPVDWPLPTVTAGGNHHALLMRNNKGGAEMCTPVTEPARTITTAGHQSLLMPYYGQSKPRPVTEPTPTVTTRDRCAVIDLEQLVDDCGFRMLEPHEVAAAMAFPDGYIPGTLSKKDRVKLAGNAVTPPVMEWVVGRVARALDGAA